MSHPLDQEGVLTPAIAIHMLTGGARGEMCESRDHGCEASNLHLRLKNVAGSCTTESSTLLVAQVLPQTGKDVYLFFSTSYLSVC